MPFARSTPATSKSQPPGRSLTLLSIPKVTPASRDTSQTNPDGPAHARYTSPPMPIDGTAPSSVLSLSRQSPGVSETRIGTANDRPPSVDRENMMCDRQSGDLLPYSSKRVQATYTCDSPDVVRVAASHG